MAEGEWGRAGSGCGALPWQEERTLSVVSGRMRAVVCGLGGVTVRRRGGATV